MSANEQIYRAGTLSYTKPKLVILVCWLLWGDLCYMLMETVIPSILPLKFKAIGASNASIGLIISTIPMILNTVLNPIVSFRSDRYRSRWGRRIPFILFTLPMVVIFLWGVGLSDRIAFWAQPHFPALLGRFSPTALALLVAGALVTVFSFFNTFVNSIFWYLFNDVVPEHLLARFMSWFRMVSTIAASSYNFFVFKYAGTHSTEIFFGIGLLYAVGFGLMCFNVKEGKYPPPPKYEDGQTGILAAVKTYGKECHRVPHYWYMFLIGICVGGAGVINPFMLFFYQSTGLTLEQIGHVNGVLYITVSVMILGSGWLADRIHPIRVVMAGCILQVTLMLPCMMLWLFWNPTPHQSYYLWMGITVGLVAPSIALVGLLDPPLFMRIFPRARYGQFCSATAIWRSGSMILNGWLVGVFLDVVKARWGEKVAYRCLPVWQMFYVMSMTVLVILLYRSWKRYGGDEAYVPPDPAGAPVLDNGEKKR